MGTDLNNVDLAALTEGTFVHATLDHGGVMHFCVNSPSEGQVTIYVAGLKPMKATITNEVGEHILALGDTLSLGGEPTPRTVTSLEVGGGLIKLSIPGGTPEDLAELVDLLRAQSGVDVLSLSRSGDPEVTAAE